MDNQEGQMQQIKLFRSPSFQKQNSEGYTSNKSVSTSSSESFTASVSGKKEENKGKFVTLCMFAFPTYFSKLFLFSYK